MYCCRCSVDHDMVILVGCSRDIVVDFDCDHDMVFEVAVGGDHDLVIVHVGGCYDSVVVVSCVCDTVL